MPLQEQRETFRVDDIIYFDYKIINVPDKQLATDEDVFGPAGQKYLETSQNLQNIDAEIAELTSAVALKDPTIAHFFNLLNSKIEFLSRMVLLENKLKFHEVNLSLGGMAFNVEKKLSPHTYLKLVIYTKPKMVPIIVGAHVVTSKLMDNQQYKVAVRFDKLTFEQEDLLAQHIMQVQIKQRQQFHGQSS